MKACMSAEPLPTIDPDLPRISRLQNVRLVLGLLETNSPFHNPQHGKTPTWITDWFAADELGHDMTAVAL